MSRGIDRLRRQIHHKVISTLSVFVALDPWTHPRLLGQTTLAYYTALCNLTGATYWSIDMNCETFFMTPHVWHDPRTYHSSWNYNDGFLDPQMIAPGNNPAHSHHHSGNQSAHTSLSMPPYNTQYNQPEFWNTMHQQPYHGRPLVHGQHSPQQLPPHGAFAPYQHFAMLSVHSNSRDQPRQ